MYFDTSILFTAHHIVSAARSPGRRLVTAMWWCRGLGQAWRLSAVKGVEKSKSKINKTHICVHLGFFSGISSCEHQIFDMMKSQLSFVDSVYSYTVADVSVKKLQN